MATVEGHKNLNPWPLVPGLARTMPEQRRHRVRRDRSRVKRRPQTERRHGEPGGAPAVAPGIRRVTRAASPPTVDAPPAAAATGTKRCPERSVIGSRVCRAEGLVVTTQEGDRRVGDLRGTTSSIGSPHALHAGRNRGGDEHITQARPPARVRRAN